MQYPLWYAVSVLRVPEDVFILSPAPWNTQDLWGQSHTEISFVDEWSKSRWCHGNKLRLRRFHLINLRKKYILTTRCYFSEMNAPIQLYLNYQIQCIFFQDEALPSSIVMPILVHLSVWQIHLNGYAIYLLSYQAKINSYRCCCYGSLLFFSLQWKIINSSSFLWIWCTRQTLEKRVKKETLSFASNFSYIVTLIVSLD